MVRISVYMKEPSSIKSWIFFSIVRLEVAPLIAPVKMAGVREKFAGSKFRQIMHNSLPVQVLFKALYQNKPLMPNYIPQITGQSFYHILPPINTNTVPKIIPTLFATKSNLEAPIPLVQSRVSQDHPQLSEITKANHKCP